MATSVMSGHRSILKIWLLPRLVELDFYTSKFMHGDSGTVLENPSVDCAVCQVICAGCFD